MSPRDRTPDEQDAGAHAPDDPGPDDGFEVTDVLDLHTFLPRDVPDLVDDYLDECERREFSQVRIIHGKGRGTLRRIVHARLERHPAVVSFQLAPDAGGNWGATIAVLRPRAATRGDEGE